MYTPPIQGSLPPGGDAFDFAPAYSGEQTTTHQMRFPVAAVEGVPFEIGLKSIANSQGGEGGWVRAKLRFEGLPAGTSITSCKGYRQDQPVPALATSWGRVKAAYR
jgi:hypothetical protein